MATKHHSWLGFFLSLLFHSALIGAVWYAVKQDDSANGHMAQLVDTNISMEMIMGMVEEEPEPTPAPAAEPEPVAKETVADPTLKPQPPKPEKPKEPEQKKEKPKPKPKEKPKNKPKEPLRKDLPKGDRNVNSEAKVNSLATGPGAVTTNNPNLVGSGVSADELSAYRTALRREIERHKRYPQRAKMMRKQGIVTVNFSIGADGSLSQVGMSKSSGSDDLDKAAMAAVQSARSVGPRPAGMSASLSVPISFKLQ